MGEDDRGSRVSGDQTKESTFQDRQADLVLEEVEPDVSTSPEAVKILKEQGVDAYRKWLAEQG